MTFARKTLIQALAAAALVLPGAGALAAGGGGHVEDRAFSFEGPFGTYDKYQLQRGFQVFNNVCNGCHGLRYVAFRDLASSTGPAFPDEQVKAFAETYTCKDPLAEDGERPCKASDKFPVVTSAGAPDLSLMAKARAGFHGPYGLGINQLMKGTGGAEYIAALLTGYNGEESEVAGSVLYGNDVFPGGLISMAQPLYGEDVEYEVFGGEAGEHGYTPPPNTLEQHAEDVAAFLMWTAEPKMVERKEAGFRNVIWLIILAALLYFTNKKIWAPIKREH